MGARTFIQNQKWTYSPELSVYKDCYDLLLKKYGLSKNFSKDTRYTMGWGIQKGVFELSYAQLLLIQVF